MKRLNKLFGTVIILAVLMTATQSCKKNELGMTITLKMKTTSVTVPQKALANTIEWTSGSVLIREIVFDGELADGSSVSITHEQLSEIDLITGTATPEINVVIPAGEYTDVNLGIEIQDENDVPSVIAEGTYTDANNNAIPIRFEFNSGEVFEADFDSVIFDTNTAPTAVIDFNPSIWFAPVTSGMLDSAERINGVILVNETYNKDIFDIVADKLDDATEGDFELEDD